MFRKPSADSAEGFVLASDCVFCTKNITTPGASVPGVVVFINKRTAHLYPIFDHPQTKKRGNID